MESGKGKAQETTGIVHEASGEDRFQGVFALQLKLVSMHWVCLPSERTDLVKRTPGYLYTNRNLTWNAKNEQETFFPRVEKTDVSEVTSYKQKSKTNREPA